MENKLTIFWIEDNPIQFNAERKNGKQYPKFLHEEFITYCLFQHPKQVEEYLLMISIFKNTTHALAEKCQNALPDIVVFDYQMADAFYNNKNALSYYDKDHNIYLQNKSASHKLKEVFEEQFKDRLLFLDREDVKGLEYGEDKFKEEFKALEMQSDDEFGLYCGITIVREFKEYITVGIPATINKIDKTTMTYGSLFFEWINSYDLKDALERPAQSIEMKEWSKILEFSVNLLRKRILVQIQTGKAIPNYSQLNDLVEGTISKEWVFSFETIYGKRDLPLKGLFIDVLDENEQRIEIQKWASEVLDKLPITNTIIKRANEIADTLWNTYLNEFEDRIVLSDYTSRIDSLNNKEKLYLEEVKTRLGVNPTTGLIANECSIKELLSNKDKKDKNLIRLIFLITVTQATIALEIQKVKTDFEEKFYLFTNYDYINILFPKVNFKKSILLSMNVTNRNKHTDTEIRWLSNNLTIDEANEITTGYVFQIEKWILKGEKETLKSLFFEDSKYFPQWLK